MAKSSPKKSGKRTEKAAASPTKSPKKKKTSSPKKKSMEALVATSSKVANKHIPKQEETRPVPKTSFEVKDLHKKALLTLLRCVHNEQSLTYPELSAELGIGEKTKRWQCEAWRDLKKAAFIIPATGTSGETTYTLSPEGVDLAKGHASEEELADYREPLSNEEHHEKIRSRLLRIDNKGKQFGVKIFDLLLEHTDTPMTRLEMAIKIPGKSSNPECHQFYYGFKNLDKLGMVVADGKKLKSEMPTVDEEGKSEKEKKKIRGGLTTYKLSKKAFLASNQPEGDSKDNICIVKTKSTGH